MPTPIYTAFSSNGRNLMIDAPEYAEDTAFISNTESDEIKILSITPLIGMRLRLLFNDGTTRIFDVSRWMNKIAYLQPLADKGFFESVKPICCGHVVSWNKDIDFSAEFVYRESEIIQPADQ